MTALSNGQNVQVSHDDDVGQDVQVSDAKYVLLAARQVLRDISCVNPSRTSKAFKGKGSAVSQGVTSDLNASLSGLVGASA